MPREAFNREITCIFLINAQMVSSDTSYWIAILIFLRISLVLKSKWYSSSLHGIIFHVHVSQGFKLQLFLIIFHFLNKNSSFPFRTKQQIFSIWHLWTHSKSVRFGIFFVDGIFGKLGSFSSSATEDFVYMCVCFIWPLFGVSGPWSPIHFSSGSMIFNGVAKNPSNGCFQK